MMEDSLRPMMSEETRGSLVTAITPFQRLELDSSERTALTSSTEVFLLTRKVKSVSEPVMVGTRRAMPSNNPFNSGITSIVAAAAPVVVGMMLAAAARALRRSRWEPSWSF